MEETQQLLEQQLAETKASRSQLREELRRPFLACLLACLTLGLHCVIAVSIQFLFISLRQFRQPVLRLASAGSCACAGLL